MTDYRHDLMVENTLLRGELWLATRALKDYRDSRHVKAEEEGMLQVTVPASLRDKAGEVIARAQRMLKDEERGR